MATTAAISLRTLPRYRFLGSFHHEQILGGSVPDNNDVVQDRLTKAVGVCEKLGISVEVKGDIAPLQLWFGAYQGFTKAVLHIAPGSPKGSFNIPADLSLEVPEMHLIVKLHPCFQSREAIHSLEKREYEEGLKRWFAAGGLW